MSAKELVSAIARTFRDRHRSPGTARSETGPIVLTPPPRADIDAWVLVDEGDARILESHWRQVVPTPETWRSLIGDGPPDLVLLAGPLLGWDDAELTDLLDALTDREVPVVLWGEVAADRPDPLKGRPRTILRRGEGDATADGVGLGVEAWPANAALPRPAARRRPDLLTQDREPWRGLLPSHSAGVRVVVSAEAGTNPELLASSRALLALPDDPRAALRAGLVGTPVLARGSEQGSPAEPTGLAKHLDDAGVRSEVLALGTQDEYLDRRAQVLRRSVLRRHTGAAQVAHFAAAAGHALPPRSVSAVVPTNRSHEVRNILANLGRQVHGEIELILVAHGLDLDEPSLRAEATDLGVRHLTLVKASSSLTLGACMNLGLDAAGGQLIAKMDDDNIYGAEFISDLVDSAVQTGAQIVGKWAHYVWLRSSGAVVLRYPHAEHTFERRVQGGAMLLDGELVRAVRFKDIPRAVDSDILDRSRECGARIYSADRFNFVSVRGASTSGHTWKAEDITFLTPSGRLEFYGDPTEHVTV